MTAEAKSRMASVLGASGIVIGNIRGSGDLEVRGKVQGDITLNGRLLISSTGIVIGKIEAKTLEVSGQVQGDLRADDGLHITHSGQVVGQIEAPRVGIEAGAIVRGQLITGRIEKVDTASDESKNSTSRTLGSFIQRPPRTKAQPKKNTFADQSEKSIRQDETTVGSTSESTDAKPSASKSKKKTSKPLASKRNTKELIQSLEPEDTEPQHTSEASSLIERAEASEVAVKSKPLRKRKRKARSNKPEALASQAAIKITSDKHKTKPTAEALKKKTTSDAPGHQRSGPNHSVLTLKEKKSEPNSNPQSIKKEHSSALNSPGAPKLPTFKKGTKGHRR